MRCALLGLLLTLIAFTAAAGDKQRESDIADALQVNLAPGKAVWLRADGQSFLGLHTGAEKSDNSRTAIIIHDAGDHPDQQPLIHGLRTVLPLHNWATLSVQMPLREAGADDADYYPLFDEAKARIDAAIEYCRGNGAKQIAVVGYGLGAAMAVYAVNAKPEPVMALVAISLPLPDSSLRPLQVGEFLNNITTPVLDIYAEFDLPEVADTARHRRALAKDNPVFRQVKIDGENHDYQNDPGMLVKRVYSWLALTLAEH